MEQAMGVARARQAWELAVREAGVVSGDPPPEELLSIAEVLERGGPPLPVFGKSLRVRLETYLELLGRHGVAGPEDDAGASRSMPDVLRDHERLLEIQELGLLSPEVNAVLRDYAECASERLELPVSLISVVLDEAQHFAAQRGLTDWLEDVGGTPVEWSFCRLAVAFHDDFVVEDATTHEAVKDNPLVKYDGIRCYAGVPLITQRGHCVGTLCVIGTEPRRFSSEDIEVLRSLASEAMHRIEARAAARNSEAPRRVERPHCGGGAM